MTLLDELPFVLPPDVAAHYRAAAPSSDLLAGTLPPLAPEARVLLLGGALDPLALALARRTPRGTCVVAEDDAAAGARLAELAAKVGIANLLAEDPARLSAEAQAGGLAPFDLALANTLYHPSKHMTLELLRLGRHLVRPGASLYVCGAKDRGILSIVEETKRLFGNVSVPAMRKGQRVAVAVKEPGAAPERFAWPDPSSAPAAPVTARGESLLLTPSPLVFAGGRLDPAAAMLAEAMRVEPDDIVVDLGCGAGIVGLVAARLAPRGHVYLLDASYAAVRTAQVNAERNALTNVTAQAGDGPALMAAEAAPRPTLVVTNPPFHSGQVESRRLAAHFIAAAAARLVPDGRLYLVANRFLAYEPVARAHFAEVTEVAGDPRYKVLLARHPRATPAAEA